MQKAGIKVNQVLKCLEIKYKNCYVVFPKNYKTLLRDINKDSINGHIQQMTK